MVGGKQEIVKSAPLNPEILASIWYDVEVIVK